MERLPEKRSSGISRETLRNWGAIFMAAGILGRGVIQAQILGIGKVSMAALLEQMMASSEVMTLTTVSLVLQAVETCAIPVYALLLVEGVQHTSSRVRYLGRVLALAVVCEIPYNLLMGGSFLDLESRNPVFGLALSLAMLCFYCYYNAPGFRNVLIKVVVTVAAVLWCQMLTVSHGACLALVSASLWAMRGRPNFRGFVGAAASGVCTVFSPFYLAAPMGFLAVHMYNGEKESQSNWKGYLIYPVMLILAAAAGWVL